MKRMRPVKNKPNKTKRPRIKTKNPWLRVLLTLFFVMMAYRWIVMELDIARIKENIRYQQEVNNETLAEKTKWENTYNSLDKDEFIMSEVRDRLGMVLPGEIIIKDGTPKKEQTKENSSQDEENSENTAEQP